MRGDSSANAKNNFERITVHCDLEPSISRLKATDITTELFPGPSAIYYLIVFL